MGKRRVSYRVLVGKTGRKRSLVRPTHIWKIILKLIFKNRKGKEDLVNLIQDGGKEWSVVKPAMNIWFP
jgi:hypothetical protein